MPQHPRTIFRHFQAGVLTIASTDAPPFASFTAVRSVSADASDGFALRHIELLMTRGLVHASLGNEHMVTGISGFFKWPEDAATPTISTIDLENRTKIFGRRSWVVQGSTPRTSSIRLKSARLTLGEELWIFDLKRSETDVGITLHAKGEYSHYETTA